MPMPVSYKEVLVNLIGGGAPTTIYAALHTANIATAGNEVLGTDGYLRQAVTLKSAGAGTALRAIDHPTIPGTVPVCTFNVPSGVIIMSIAYWTAATRGQGSIIWYYDITPDEVFGNTGRADLNSGSISLGDISG
jgi:hypothetical protein